VVAVVAVVEVTLVAAVVVVAATVVAVELLPTVVASVTSQAGRPPFKESTQYMSTRFVS
jgi:hypothetical protein